jgi:FlaA1/EpsC-like NDP-sugar epimerase
MRIFAGAKTKKVVSDEDHKIKVAIIGAGRVGVSLAEELMANVNAFYLPRCFVDASAEKANRSIHGIPVILESEATADQLKRFEVQEVVFAIPNLEDDKKKEMCDRYLQAGFKIKVYDYPVMQIAGKKRYMREFDIEELLFRKPVEVTDQRTKNYYKNKRILITGGGGSIGSELCRQLAKMEPEEIVILDIYENGAYDVQQELKIAYGSELNIGIEICSITDKKAMERVFLRHKPQIVINAAAHKHVPLMESNCIEAIVNNVFGTKNIVELCEKFNVERFMMVSTDKAVNPTNVMGATKRLCEMIVNCASVNGKVKYSSTRFGNVLGSAGSVIPLFKRQITNGGPVTITDKRIIRYFMTIPEASQLVLQSGAMADNGELFVLDMGQPVKILDLAENMIRMSGLSGIEIVETGLRPGEKLYEELLIRQEDLEKTDNKLIFIEKDEPISKEEMDAVLSMLKEACDSGDDELARMTLKKAVPTYKLPDEINLKFDNLNDVTISKEEASV